MPVLSRQIGPVQPEQLQGESTWGETFGAAAKEAWETGPTGSLNTWANIRASEDGRVPELLWASGVGIAVGLNALSNMGDEPSKKLAPADAQQKVKDAGVEKDVPLAKFPQGIRQDTLDLLISKNRDKQARQTIMSEYDGWTPAVAGMLAGSLIDPSNIALSFIPVVGEARYAKLIASAGESAFARAGVRAGVGAAEGAVGAAIAEPLIYAGQQQWRNDYSAKDSMLNIAGGAFFGSLLHAGAGLVKDSFGRPIVSPELETEVRVAKDITRGAPDAREMDWMRPMDTDRALIESRIQAQKPGDIDAARPIAIDRLRTEIEADLIGRSSGVADPNVVAAARTDLSLVSKQLDALDSRYRETVKQWNSQEGITRKQAETLAKRQLADERANLEGRRDRATDIIETNKDASDAVAELSAFQTKGEIPSAWRSRVEVESERLINPAAPSARASSSDLFFGVRPFVASLNPDTQAMSLRHAVAQAIEGRPIDVTPAMLADSRFAADPEAFRIATRRAMDNAQQVEGANIKAASEAQARVDEGRPDTLEEAKKRLAEDEEMLRDKGGDPKQIELEDDNLKLTTDAVKAATLCMMRTGG